MGIQKTKIQYGHRLGSQNERGAALIEAAIIFMPLALILFGIIEYGVIYKDSLTLSSATRAGARTASASPHESSFYSSTVSAVTSGTTAITFKIGDSLKIYKVNATTNNTGEPPTVCTGSSCVQYTWNGTQFVTSRPSTELATLISSQEACLDSADSVGVQLTFSHDALSGFFTNMQMHESTIMRLEPADQTCGS